MSELTEFELGVLRAIIARYPEHADGLTRQLECAQVTERENSGSGFFALLHVGEEAAPVRTDSPLGVDVGVHVPGLERGLGLLLFMEAGRLSMLEGFVLGEDSTSLDLENPPFEIYRLERGSKIPPSPFWD